MKKFSILILMAALVSGTAHAQIESAQLRDELTTELSSAVLQQVITDSKTKGSALSQILAENDVVDGRNSEGTYNVPLLESDIKLTLVGGENQFGSYCTAIENSTNLTCSNGDSARFLVTIVGAQGVHKAVELLAINVVYDAQIQNSWQEDENGNTVGSEKSNTSVQFVKKIDLAE